MYIYIYKYYIYILYTPSQLGSHGMLSTAARLARSNDERSLLEELRSLEENLWRLLDGRRKEHQRTSNPASHVGQKNVIWQKLRMLSIFGMSQNPVFSHSIPVWKQFSHERCDV